MQNRQRRFVSLIALVLCAVLLAGCVSTEVQKEQKEQAEQAEQAEQTEQAEQAEQTEQTEQAEQTEQTEQTEQSNALSFNIIGGKDVMPIAGFGAWVSPYSKNGNNWSQNFVTEEYFQLFADAGINWISYGLIDYATNPELVIKALELGEKYGIGITVYDSTIINKAGKDNVTVDEIAQQVAKYCDYPAFAGVYLVDEPEVPYFNNGGSGTKPLTNYTKLAQILNEDLDLYVYTSLFQCHIDDWLGAYEQYVDEYLDTCKPNMLEYCYYIHDKTAEGSMPAYLWCVTMMRQKAQKNGIPLKCTIGAGTNWNDYHRLFDSVNNVPTEAQFNWQANVYLSFGAQALSYFPLMQPMHFAEALSTEWDFQRNGLLGYAGNKTRWYHYAQNLNKHIAVIDEVLMNSVSKGIVINGDALSKDMKLVKEDKELANCIIESGSYNELQSVTGDTLVGCFNYRGKTALYVTNYDMEYAQYITLNFDGEQNIKMVQNAETSYVKAKKLTLDMAAGEGVLLVIE